MSTPPTPTTPSTEPHGFELKKRRRWPWIAGIAVVAVAAATAIAVPLLNPAKSANATEGATLIVATAEGNAAEQALVNFVAEEVAPLPPRAIPERPVAMRLSGLEPFELVA